MSESLRRHTDYGQVGLDEADLLRDPIEQFLAWLHDAESAEVFEPNAMVLGTVGADGAPSSRTVLLRAASPLGFEFVTTLSSRKGRELRAQRSVSLLFPWYSLRRQVIVLGDAAPIAESVADAYWADRPRGSQISAWASEQSEPVAGRDVLERRVDEYGVRFSGVDVPRPPQWGAVRVVPRSIEFWQGRSSRLHDRLRFERADATGGWALRRLQP
jgi:pyridoxamine 5'-phosphate oxidase